MLGTRATEGENGLIPRQEYEALSTVEYMTKYPELWDLITEEVGGDGVIDIGATARREIGTKVNALHVWCAGASFVTGRGITMGLGHFGPTDRAEAIARAFQFNRRLARGMWGDEGGMFASQRNYRVPLLEGTTWLERFREEAVFFDDPEQKAMYTKFNATAQLLVFLLHFDNRLGLGDSGPYPTEDGGFLIVRDHFLNDPGVPLVRRGRGAAALHHAGDVLQAAAGDEGDRQRPVDDVHPAGELHPLHDRHGGLRARQVGHAGLRRPAR